MKVFDDRPVGECKQTVTFASMEGDLTMVSDSRFTSRRCVKERRVRRAGREFLFSNQEIFSEGNGGNVTAWVFPLCTGSRGCLAIIVVGVNVGGTRLFFYAIGTVKSGILGILGIPSCGQPTVELEKSVGKSKTLAWSSLKSPPGECAFSRE